MEKIPYAQNRELEVLAEADCLVAGGGPGGFAAALMAAENGAATVLVERYGALGGMASFGEVTPFMGNSIWKGSAQDGHWDVLDRPVWTRWQEAMHRYLPESIRAKFDSAEDNYHVCKEAAMLAMEDLLLAAGVRIIYHHTLVDVVRHENMLEYAVFRSKSGLGAIKAKIFIDSTGDGDLAVLAGVPWELGNEEGFCQPMTLCFKVGGVDRSKMPDRKTINEIYERAKAAGRITCPRENVLWFTTLQEDVIHFNTTRIIRKNGVNGMDLSEAELEGRRQMREIIQFLREEVPGMADIHIHSAAHHIGIRETRRIRGRHYQTKEDFSSARKYPDAIARVRYDIDIHNPNGSGTCIIRMDVRDWYEISYRTIVAEKIDNLLIGCRAISVDHALHSSCRVMPPVCSVGQAAGMAAAMCLQKKCLPPELSGVELRQKLREAGAHL